MVQAGKNPIRKEFTVPEGIVFAYVDKRTGRLAENKNPNRVRVAFRADTVPLRDGSNLSRIGEPGARTMSTVQENLDPSTPKVVPEDDDSSEETDDYLRQGYQE